MYVKTEQKIYFSLKEDLAHLALLMAIFIFFWPTSAFAQKPSVEQGKKLFEIHCYQCHGLEGKGDGSATEYLARSPRDFTDGVFKLKTSSPKTMVTRDEDIFYAISSGLSASGMPPWGKVLSEKEIWDLVVFIKSLSDLFEDTPNPPPLDVSGKIPYSEDSVRRGAKVFREFKCYECHGPGGEGPSIKELKDDYGVRIWPRDLTRPSTFIGPYTPNALYARVTNGVPLTPMPMFVSHGLKDEYMNKRWDVVNYVMWLALEAEKRRKKERRIMAVVGMVLLGVTAPFIIPRIRRRLKNRG